MRIQRSNLKWSDVYKGDDKTLARPDWKKQLKDRHFSSDAEVIAAAETWLDGQPSDIFFFFSGFQKLEFGCCSLFPSWSDKDLSAHRYRYEDVSSGVQKVLAYFVLLLQAEV